MRGLEDLARASRARSDAKIAAVTGSAGKTTTKEILRLALGALGSTHCSAASYNNHWGVPLSLASMPRDSRYAVFEIGMNHFGEIRSLVSLVRPHVALVTTIAPAHLEFFSTCEAIADAKSEIFERIEPGGAALILRAGLPHVGRLIARARQSHVARILTFGEAGDAKLVSYDGARVKAEILGTLVEFSTGAPGRHIATNALGALLAVAALDGDVLNAAAALKGFSALKGRGARFDAGGVEVIDESYNANPASMVAALGLPGESKAGAATPCSATCWNWAPTRKCITYGLACADRSGEGRPRLPRRTVDARAVGQVARLAPRRLGRDLQRDRRASHEGTARRATWSW